MWSTSHNDEMDLLSLTVRKHTHPQLALDTDVLRARLDDIKTSKQEMLSNLGVTRTELMSTEKFAGLLRAAVPGLQIPLKQGKNGLIPAFAKNDEGLQKMMLDLRLAPWIVARLAMKSTGEETRIERFLEVAAATGGRLPVPLLYYGAHTGRFSGLDKLNLQNMGRKSAMRKAIRALKPGYVILAGDLSQIEARLVAVLAGAWDLVRAFATGRDVYSEFASIHYGRPINKDDNPDERFVGKQGILSLGFGVGADKFYNTMNFQHRVTMELEECIAVVRTYRSAYPAVTLMWTKLREVIEYMITGRTYHFPEHAPCVYAAKNKVVLPNGMPLMYPNLGFRKFDPADVTKTYCYKTPEGMVRIYGAKLFENIVQALARIIVTSAELRLARAGLFAALSVHDELVFAVPERHADQYKQLVERELQRPVPWLPQLPVACEVKWGDTYADCK